MSQYETGGGCSSCSSSSLTSFGRTGCPFRFRIELRLTFLHLSLLLTALPLTPFSDTPLLLILPSNPIVHNRLSTRYCSPQPMLSVCRKGRPFSFRICVILFWLIFFSCDASFFCQKKSTPSSNVTCVSSWEYVLQCPVQLLSRGRNTSGGRK